MKILLYEPGESGHRPVYLRYLEHGLPKLGVKVLVLKDKRFKRLGRDEVIALKRIALEEGCDGVHLLTLDGAARQWTLFGPKLKTLNVPVFANYYLYSNIWGLKGVFWNWARKVGYFDHLFISDPALDQRLLLPGVRSYLIPVPDTWSKAEFPEWSKTSARVRLSLPLDRFVFLVFGEISQRKGIDRILRAFSFDNLKDSRLLVVGTVAEDSTNLVYNAVADPKICDRLVLRQGHVPEDLVSAYFYAADAVLSDYPKSFSVSSGAFTKCLASLAVPIIPNHGVNAIVAKRLGFGYVYKGECVTSLNLAMRKVVQFGCLPNNDVLAKVRRESDSRELKHYLAAIKDAYDRRKRMSETTVHPH